MRKLKKNKLSKKISITNKAMLGQKKYLVIAIFCVVTLLISSSYALLTNFDQTDEVITFKTGKLNMSVNNTLIDLSGNLPEGDTNGLANATPITLTLTNTGTMFIDGYDVKLVSDENKTSTLNEDYIKYAISEDGVTYSKASILTSNNNIIFSGYDLDIDQSKTIYLKVWIDEKAGNNALNKEYYGSIQVDLYQKKENPNQKATDVLKQKVGTGGLVAVNTDGTLYDGTGEIREYRYSGLNVNNYIYYNCSDTAGNYSYGDLDYDYESNCEKWRILGIFKENNEWYLKLLRNNTLEVGIIPSSYVYNTLTHVLAESTTSNKSAWNNHLNGSITDNNDWATAGLQFFLNSEQDESATPVTGYLGTLSSTSKSMLRNTTHYLGDITYGTGNENTVAAYNAERDSDNVWTNNQFTWSGKVGLMYASDFGYTADSSYWNTASLGAYGDSAFTTSWLTSANHSYFEWLITPSNDQSNYVTDWYTNNSLSHGGVDLSYEVRPTVNIISNTRLVKGDGSEGSPYVIDEIPLPPGAEEIISLYGTDSGLVAVNTEGTLYDGTGEIREYRYSGTDVNNYVVFNDDGDGVTEDDEQWRIVGAFNDNEEQKWNLRLVRETPITYEEIPLNYRINGIDYTLVEDSESEPIANKYSSHASFMKNNIYQITAANKYFNWNSGGSSDWSVAGLQYYLNTENDENGELGYYSRFTETAKSLIDTNYKYYLGNVNKDSLVNEQYLQERSNKLCSSSIYENSHENNCDIWDGNQAIWNGAVGLLYPSDVGYASERSSWSDENAGYSNSWLMETFGDSEWLISPSKYFSSYVTYFDGYWISNDSCIMPGAQIFSFRPVLNLVSDAPIDINHLGTEEDPYVIIE